jgi:hypothetical protein
MSEAVTAAMAAAVFVVRFMFHAVARMAVMAATGAMLS